MWLWCTSLLCRPTSAKLDFISIYVGYPRWVFKLGFTRILGFPACLFIQCCCSTSLCPSWHQYTALVVNLCPHVPQRLRIFQWVLASISSSVTVHGPCCWYGYATRYLSTMCFDVNFCWDFYSVLVISNCWTVWSLIFFSPMFVNFILKNFATF